MLVPDDYSMEKLLDPATRALMAKMDFEHGGPEYDARYPDGIPTSVVITDAAGKTHDSGLVMYPAGHARNAEADLELILRHKFALLGMIGLPDGHDVLALVNRFEKLDGMNVSELQGIYDFELASRPGYE
jgi:2-methylcitrate dehydratase